MLQVITILLPIAVMIGVGVWCRASGFLTDAGIEYEYGTLIPRIQNRKSDGLCPMESAVMDISDADEAYAVLREKLKTAK